jgi:hypothetical protein
MKMGTWQHRIEPVEYDPTGAGYQKDKYKLHSMEVGESLFHAGVPNYRISGYTAQLHKRTNKRYLVLKHIKDGIPGTLVIRTTDKGGAT